MFVCSVCNREHTRPYWAKVCEKRHHQDAAYTRISGKCPVCETQLYAEFDCCGKLVAQNCVACGWIHEAALAYESLVCA